MNQHGKTPTKTANPNIPYIPLSQEELDIVGIMEITDVVEEGLMLGLCAVFSVIAIVTLGVINTGYTILLVLLVLLFMRLGLYIRNERLKYERYLEAVHAHRKIKPDVSFESTSIVNALDQALKDGDLS